MSKLSLSDPTNLINSTAIATIAANNRAIETALTNTLSRDGSSPNEMNASLDMNSNRILNLPEPVNVNEPVRLQDLTSAALSSFLTVDTSTVYAGTDGYVLYNNAGILGNLSLATYLASPPAIGGTAAAAGTFTSLSATTISGAGSFTTLSASSTVSGAGFSAYLASPPAIGGTAPAAGNFTTLGATGLTTMTTFSATGLSYSSSQVLTVTSSIAYAPQIKLINTTADSSAPYWNTYKYRGAAGPNANDNLGTFNFGGLDSLGTSLRNAVDIIAVAASVGATFIEGRLAFSITNSAGVQSTRMNIGGSSITSYLPTTITDTTASASTTTGALIVSGGVGIAGGSYIGGTLNVTGISTLTQMVSDVTDPTQTVSVPTFDITNPSGRTQFSITTTATSSGPTADTAFRSQYILNSGATAGGVGCAIYGGVLIKDDGHDPGAILGVVRNEIGATMTTPYGRALWGITRGDVATGGGVSYVDCLAIVAENTDGQHARAGINIYSSTTSNPFDIGVIVGNAVTAGIRLGGSGLVIPTDFITAYDTSGSLVFGVDGSGNVTSADTTAFTSYTPTIAATSGTITTPGTCTGWYKKIGKKLTVTMQLSITTNGTGAGVLTATLPASLTAHGVWMLTARSSAGSMCIGITTNGSNTISLVNYTSGYPGADGVTINVSGTIEVT